MTVCVETLTARQIAILQHIAEGESSVEIGQALWLSTKTVDNAANEIIGRLGARNRAHAVALAMRRGLIR